MDQTLAFEIGAVFFLVVLFMAGTKVGGVFPALGRNVKYVLIAGVVIVLGVGALHMWPQAYGSLLSIFSDSSPSTAAVSSNPSPHADPAPARIAAPKRANPEAGKVSRVEFVVKAAPEPVAVEKIEAKPELPASVEESTPAKESRSKRALKSIGHALHLGKKNPSENPQ